MSNKGWICPRCDKVNSPYVKQCDCSSNKTAPCNTPEPEERDDWGFNSDNVCVTCDGINGQHKAGCHYQ